MAVAEMPTHGYVWTIILCNILLPHWGLTSPIPALLDDPVGVADPAFLEQDDTNVDVQALLGQFLYMLNLTEQGPSQSQRTRNPGYVQPPEYMLELYNHYANDRTTVPAANIARSFKNEDSSPRSVTSRGVTTHPLTFNVSVPRQERVIVAELRLYMTVRRHPGRRHGVGGVDWKVTIFEMQDDDDDGESPPHRTSEAPVREIGGEPVLIGTRELATKRGRRKESGWEAFDLTDPVRRWRNAEVTSHRLELHVESGDGDDGNDEDVESRSWREDGVKEDGVKESSSVDVERSPEGKREPVLIVFSDKESERGEAKIPDGNNELPNADEKQRDEALFLQMRSNAVYDSVPPRTRRNAKGNHCKRTPLYVDFKDIGWDSWVVAPPGFEAYTCHGVCTYPLAPQVTPTKHAIIQTLVNLKNPQRVSQACCVPTKLEPISLLYENEFGHVIFQHKYEGMVVAECGCR